MSIDASAPWHRQSFDTFLAERLPRLLAERLPLAGYEATSTGDYACRVAVTIAAAGHEVTVTYAEVPQPDAAGVFDLDGARRVVLPTASSEDLDTARIRCVGEHLYDYFEEHLGEAPKELPWDERLVRSLLPLDVWIRRYVAGETTDISQRLSEMNWLDRQSHLRTVFVPGGQKLIAPGQLGRVCSFETPEGTNIGRVLKVAAGATIRDGRIVIVDASPEGGLGLAASMIPFLEHNDPNRTLMGANMMRQAFVPPNPEPAYVQTGNEPDAPDFWYGRNLLTAFVSWGTDTFEDGIAISESAATRLDYPHPVEPGDKLSNRHGSKGTVSRILPDEQMPHLADGTAVELAFSFVGCHTRLNFGQIREAVMGRIARAEGAPVVVPPLQAPGEDELRKRLAAAGLPESGMETLTLGRDGNRLERPSTVGWIYWGRSHHLVSDKIHASVTLEHCNLQAWGEYFELRNVGAFETIAETFNTRSVDRPGADTLAQQVAKGAVDQAGAPSPKFATLVQRLSMVGFRAEFDGEKIRFGFAPAEAPPEGETLELACPMPHPWLGERHISEIGVFEVEPEYPAVVEANLRLQGLLAAGVPQSLRDSAREQLGVSLGNWADAMMRGTDVLRRSFEGLLIGNRVLFSGRTVISPGGDLRIDQLGVADEIAWTIFAPLVERELGDAGAVNERSSSAAEALDRIMAESWVILNRAPTTGPTSLLAFRPVREPDNVIRLHPLATRLMNADFDGDQAAVFLPITDAGQREAGELLSVAGHLKRDQSLIRTVVPVDAPLWGLALLSLTEAGRKEIADLAGVAVEVPEGFVTHETLVKAMRATLDAHGAEHMLDVLERLTRRGFEAAMRSGASISPFFGSSLDTPAQPKGENLDEWRTYAALVAECVASRTDYQDDDLGPQLLAVKCGARGSIGQLMALLGPRILDLSFAPTELAGDFDNFPFVQHQGYCQGLTSRELYAAAVPARLGMGMIALQCTNAGYATRQAGPSRGFTVLARALRRALLAENPGIVFARAAAIGEVDPLTDLDSRLFVGLPPG